MKLPKISAYCATYGRPKVLEEAVESFLRQDYEGQKELIILNDFEKHKLYYDHPEIKIYNLDQKIYPLGKKFNETVKLCSGEILFTWEDDDIYLPNRVSLTIKKMFESNKKIFHTKQGYVEDGEKNILNSIEYWKTSVLFHSNMAIYKDLFEEAGGYNENDEIDLDFKSMQKFFELENYQSEKISQNEIFYIYRIKTGSYHATCLSYEDKSNLSNLAEQYVAENNQIFGEYKLNPYWRYNYCASVEKVKKTKKFKLFKLVSKQKAF